MFTRAYFMKGYRYKDGSAKSLGDSFALYHHCSFFPEPSVPLRRWIDDVKKLYPGEDLMVEVMTKV